MLEKVCASRVVSFYVFFSFRIVEPDTCDTRGIFNAILQKCQENQLNLTSCLTATAADGASVNFGKKTGVLTQLQEQLAQWMIRLHCIAHRLELCLKDAFKDTYFTQVCSNTMRPFLTVYTLHTVTI